MGSIQKMHIQVLVGLACYYRQFLLHLVCMVRGIIPKTFEDLEAMSVM